MKTYQYNNGTAFDEHGNIVAIEFGKPHQITGSSIIVFDNQQELDAYISALPVIWDKGSYCNALNEAHNALFRKYYTARNYLSIGEISVWVDDADFGTEANALIAWWQTTCKLVGAHLDTVTEETAVAVDEFLNQLPLL